MRALIVLAALMAGLAGAVQAVISHRASSGWRQLRSGMMTDLQRGGLHALQRARLVALRLAVAEKDPDTGAILAYLGARLALGYGLPFEHQADDAAARAEKAGPSPAGRARVAAARALIELERGQRDRALSLATAAAAGGTVVEPYLALAQVRSWSGDLLGASGALEAARMVAPEAGEAQVAWAEARIDLGEASSALESLERFTRTVPDDTEAQLLTAEALDALGGSLDQARSTALAAACARDGRVSPVLAAACALQRASRARLGGDATVAVEEARRAARAAPTHPRLLGRIAQLLAQLGLVDEADALLTAARPRGHQDMPALAWARLAVALGRGQVALPPEDLHTTDATNRVIAARAAFAVGGVPGLEAWMSNSSPPGSAPSGDPELHLLRSFMQPGFTQHSPGPVGAYLSGLRARLQGDLPTAARHLADGLEGHADACRAAGEYAATLVALGRPVDPAVLAPLRKTNARCVNLDPATLAPPVPSVRKKRR